MVLLITGQKSFGQCPTPSSTIIQSQDEQCYKSNDGEIKFIFVDGDAPDGTNYRIRLYDYIIADFVYDDNNIPGQNLVPPPTFDPGPKSMSFTNVPPGESTQLLLPSNKGIGSVCNAFVA